jgi:hypothetical protein
LLSVISHQSSVISHYPFVIGAFSSGRELLPLTGLARPVYIHSGLGRDGPVV